MKVATATCPECNDEMYSRARHDFRYCSCKNMFVDGGPGLERVGTIRGFDKVKTGSVEIDATEKELYDDWNLSLDRFGKFRQATQTDTKGGAGDR